MAGSLRGGGAGRGAGRTLAKLAVKSTHSKSCPILWRNSSTCGRFSTYTCNGRRHRHQPHSSWTAWASRAAPGGPLPAARFGLESWM